MRRTFYLVLLLVLWLASKIKAQSSCSSATTCDECYAIPNCAWCTERNFFPTKTRPRCEVHGILSSYCNKIEDMQSSTILNKNELNSDNQISINSAKVYLRAGDTQSVRVSVRPVLNFPVDFYFLLDLSGSLADDLENIKRLSQDIINSIRGKSTRFQIGFGTYVDKLTPPYVSHTQLRNTCRLCFRVQTPISYVHNIGLTNNSALFTDGFQNIKISTNADDPEGTFDAIFQAALCDQVVGWRHNARKIMLIITDDLSHTAGDGKLAGIVRPPPFECLTTFEESTGAITYTSNLKYDYPSVNQIRSVLIKTAITPVFAVTKSHIGQYNKIVSLLDGTNAATAILDDDSNNLLAVIETAFEQAISNVKLSFESQPDVAITYRATCPRNSKTSPDGLSCSEVVTGDTTDFTINIKLDRCSQQENITKTFNMVVPAFGRFEIEVNAICSCDCHKTDVFNSADCNNGLLTCGVCICNHEGDSSGEQDCPVSHNLVCSGRGSCDCGSTCRCHQPIFVSLGDNMYNVTHNSLSGYAIVSGEAPFVSGSACECDNFFCNRNKSHFVCSGSTNGDCVCTSDGPVCQCRRSEFGGIPYTGTACQCSAVYCYDTSVPYNSHSSKACNGHGTCHHCNHTEPCSCNLGFTGRYCETMINPSKASCIGDKDCIRCIADYENFRDMCPCQNNTMFSYMRLTSSNNEDHIIHGINADSITTQRCTFIIPSIHCKYTYHIALPYHSDGAIFIDIEPDADCIEAPMKWWHVILLLLSILAVLCMIKLVIVKICCRKERKEVDVMRQKLL